MPALSVYLNPPRPRVSGPSASELCPRGPENRTRLEVQAGFQHKSATQTVSNSISWSFCGWGTTWGPSRCPGRWLQLVACSRRGLSKQWGPCPKVFTSDAQKSRRTGWSYRWKHWVNCWRSWGLGTAPSGCSSCPVSAAGRSQLQALSGTWCDRRMRRACLQTEPQSIV